MAKLRAIHNHIIFQFEEAGARIQGIHTFKEKTDWDFEFTTADDTTKSPRWVNVIAVGPKCHNDIKPGMRVLVDSLKWTNAVRFQGEDYWRTDYDQILLIDETHI